MKHLTFLLVLMAFCYTGTIEAQFLKKLTKKLEQKLDKTTKSLEDKADKQVDKILGLEDEDEDEEFPMTDDMEMDECWGSNCCPMMVKRTFGVTRLLGS